MMVGINARFILANIKYTVFAFSDISQLFKNVAFHIYCFLLNSPWLNEAIWCQWLQSSLVLVMACQLFCNQAITWVSDDYWLIGPLETIFNDFFNQDMIHMQSYCQISNISCTKSQNSNVSCLVLQLSLLNPLKPGFKWRMKMQLEQRRQAMLRLHLSDQQCYSPLRCILY